MPKTQKIEKLKIRKAVCYIYTKNVKISNNTRFIRKVNRDFLSFRGKLLFKYDLDDWFGEDKGVGILSGKDLKNISKEDFIIVAKIFYDDVKNFNKDLKLFSYNISKDNTITVRNKAHKEHLEKIKIGDKQNEN